MSEFANEATDQIEDLLRTLHGQIKTSTWLQENTANKLEQENPDLIKAWKQAINTDEVNSISSSNITNESSESNEQTN